MGDKAFFNRMAYKWDEICVHDEEKVKEIIRLSNVKLNSKILDVGTGTGILIPYLLDTSPLKIKAIDLSENMISIAKTKCKDARVEFIVGDVMAYDSGRFDYVFLYSVYPHFSNKEALFNHIAELIKVGGRIVIAHSESKESINNIHRKNEETKEDKLPPVETTAQIMKRYFKIETMVDNEDMYYISAIKEMEG